MIADLLKGKWLGHPLHPLLVHVPMAVWPAALVFDLLSFAGVGGNAIARTSFFAIGFGLAVALLAVPTGIVDWSGIKREKPAWKIGLKKLARLSKVSRSKRLIPKSSWRRCLYEPLPFAQKDMATAFAGAAVRILLLLVVAEVSSKRARRGKSGA